MYVGKLWYFLVTTASLYTLASLQARLGYTLVITRGSSALQYYQLIRFRFVSHDLQGVCLFIWSLNVFVAIKCVDIYATWRREQGIISETLKRHQMTWLYNLPLSGLALNLALNLYYCFFFRSIMTSTSTSWMPAQGKFPVSIGSSLSRALRARKQGGTSSTTYPKRNLPSRDFYSFRCGEWNHPLSSENSTIFEFAFR